MKLKVNLKCQWEVEKDLLLKKNIFSFLIKTNYLLTDASVFLFIHSIYLFILSIYLFKIIFQNFNVENCWKLVIQHFKNF